MKQSIFLGKTDGVTLRRVYSPQVVQTLEQQAGLCPNVIIDLENIDQYQEQAKQAVYAFSTWGMPAFTKDQIKTYFPQLKGVFYAAGSVQGFAKPFLECGIKVYSAWAANAVPVAEYTVSQIILANKGFFQSCALQSAGCHDKARAYFSPLPGNYSCKVGIIGAGMIGSMVLDRLKQYQLETLVFDPFLPEDRARQLGARLCSLEELFAQCQTISNHLANNPQTVGMLNYTLFSKMKKNATFLNTGRGAQVVEEDLVRALGEATERTAVLDVTWPEPPAADHPFYRMPNVFLTPHIAGSSGNEVVRMAQYMADEFQRVNVGQPALYEVTLDKLATMA